jgi:hypothetical protein
MDDGSLIVALCTLAMTAVFGLVSFLLRRELSRYDSRRKQDVAWKAAMHQRMSRVERACKIPPDILPMTPDDQITEESA